MSNKYLNKTLFGIANDEFYTRYCDIELEMSKYKEDLRGKKIYCNCDTEASQFYKYFKANYDTIGLAGLEISDGLDFRCKASIKLLKACDIVITNPPYSKLDEYMARLVHYNKQFILVVSHLSVTRPAILPGVVADKFWYTKPLKRMMFTTPQSPDKAMDAPGCWVSSVRDTREHPFLELTQDYDPAIHPNCDDCDAIIVFKTGETPRDYYDQMLVPNHFIFKHNKEQFDLLGYRPRPLLNNKQIFKKLLIKRTCINK